MRASLERRAVLVCLCVASVTRSAHSEPQWGARWHTSWCGTGSDGKFLEHGNWCNQVVADLILARSRDADAGFGPYLAVGSADFADARFEAGMSVLLPVDVTYPLIASLGVVTTNAAGPWEPGGSAWLLWGPRSYNFHGSYSASGGLLIGAQRGFGAAQNTNLYIGLAIDGMWLALPFIAGYQWLRGPPD